MTSITPPPDDQNLQRLKFDNAAPASARAVAHTTRVKGVPETRPSPRQTEVEIRKVERRRGERRRQDRRQRKIPVVLDTRSQHDRRTRNGQRATDQEAKPATQPRRGIDVTV